MYKDTVYSPVKSDDDVETSSIDEKDAEIALLAGKNEQRGLLKSASKWRGNALLVHGILAVLNFAMLITSLYLYTSGGRQCKSLVYSPASGAVEYQARTFNSSLFSKTKYKGYPNKKISAAWRDLTSHENSVVTKEELEKLNRTSIEIEGNGYLVTLGVFHQIHCLNYIRKRLYPEHYHATEDPLTEKIHIQHCIDNIRQVIQCHGDTSILTYSWRPDYVKPWPDFQIKHECRNFDKLIQWADSRKPAITEFNMVNPYLASKKKEDWPSTSPTQFENATEITTGTRLLGIEGEEDY